MLRLRPSLAPLPLLAVTVLSAACVAASGTDGGGFLVRPSGRLTVLQPADVALVPVRNQSGTEGVPTGAMRLALYRGLVDRLYSPLDLDYVDRNWREASLGSQAAADCVLQVSVTKWDASFLQSRGVVLVSGEALLFEGGTAGGPPLWGVTLDRRFDVESAGAAWRERAAELFAADVLSRLPERNPLAAPR